jgi:hypothetical protein
LIALSPATASGAGDAAIVSLPRTLAGVNGYQPAPAIGPDGRAAVAVTDYAPGRSRVFAFTRDARGRWAAPRLLRSSKNELFEPAAVMTGDSTAVFAWVRAVRIDQQQLVEGRRILNSGEMDGVQSVSPSTGRAIFPELTAGPGSRALLGWEDDNYALSVSEVTEGGFGAPQTIFDRRQFAYAMEYADDGTAVVLSQGLGRGGVQVRLKPPTAPWTDPVTLSGPRRAREATVATGRDGTIAVAWAQNSDAGYRIQVSVRPPGGSFGEARTIDGAAGEARAPALAVQDDGGVLVSWLSGAKLDFLPRASEVRLAEVGRDGSVSEARRVSAMLRRIQTAPQVLLDADGDALLNWEESGRLMAATRSSEGKLSAPRGVSPAGAKVYGWRTVANRHGQALAAWALDQGRDGALIQVAEARF